MLATDYGSVKKLATPQFTNTYQQLKNNQSNVADKSIPGSYKVGDYAKYLSTPAKPETQADALSGLLNTGKYESFTNAAGLPDLRLKAANQTVKLGTTGIPTNTTKVNSAAPTSYVSPYQEKILAMLDKYLNPTPFKFDPTTDPNYGIMKKEGGRIFNNQIGDMSAVTGGRLNSWASSAASQAQNDYEGDSLARMEGSAYNRYENEYADIGKQLQMLQGLENESYNRYQTDETNKYNRTQNEKKDYAATVGQFADNYQAEINKVQNDGDPSNDWQVPILAATRQDKVAATKTKAEADAKALIETDFENFKSSAENDVNTLYGGNYADVIAKYENMNNVNGNHYWDKHIAYLKSLQTAQTKTNAANKTAATDKAYKQYMDLYTKDGIITNAAQAKALGKEVGDVTEAYQTHLDSVASQAATLKNTQEYQKAQLAISRGNLSVSQKNAELASLKFGYEQGQDKIKKDNIAKGLNADGSPKEPKAITTKELNTRIAAITQSFIGKLPKTVYNELANNPEEYINDIGSDEYYKLLNTYKGRTKTTED